MRNSNFSPRVTSGGARKFLYSGPKKEEDDQDDLPWSFGNKNASPRATANLGGNPSNRFDLDNVWSIKRNVNIGGKGSNSDPLAYNTNKSYYSRHGGASKDKEEFGSVGAPTSSAGNTTTASSSKTWTLGTAETRRPFSYGFNTDQTRPMETHVTPESIANSKPSFGNYNNTDKNVVNNTSSSVNNKNNTSLMNTFPHSMSQGNQSSRQNPMFNSASHNSSLFGNAPQNTTKTYKSSMFSDSGFSSGFNKQNKSFW